MTVDDMISFRSYIDKFINLIKRDEKFIGSLSIHRRKIASKTLDFMLPRLRAITIFYIKKFCNEKFIASNPAFLSSLRVDILEEVRKHVDVELPRKYAKILRSTRR